MLIEYRDLKCAQYIKRHCICEKGKDGGIQKALLSIVLGKNRNYTEIKIMATLVCSFFQRSI